MWGSVYSSATPLPLPLPPPSFPSSSASSCTAVVHSPRTRLRARTRGYLSLCVFLYTRPALGPEPGLVDTCPCAFSYIIFFRASGEAILGTLKYLSMHFTMKIFSRLRRGDFRYTKIFSMHFTMKFFSRLRRGDFRYTKIFFNAFYNEIFFAPPARRF